MDDMKRYLLPLRLQQVLGQAQAIAKDMEQSGCFPVGPPCGKGSCHGHMVWLTDSALYQCTEGPYHRETDRQLNTRLDREIAEEDARKESL